MRITAHTATRGMSVTAVACLCFFQGVVLVGRRWVCETPSAGGLGCGGGGFGTAGV